MIISASPLVDLRGKRGLVVGIANESSIAAGCAKAFRQCGARIAATYLNEKSKDWVLPVADRLDVEWTAPCDVREPGQLEALFEEVRTQWGGLDFLLHSIAFAPKEICTAGSWIALLKGSLWRWMFRATVSSAWRSWLSR